MESMTTPITLHLKRKSNRKLHENLRLLIEEKLFKDGIVPECFLQQDIPACVVAVAKALESLKIREVGGNNRGELIGYIQSSIGSYVKNGDGEPWCLSTIQCIVAFIEDFFQIESPFPSTESVMSCYTAAREIPDLVSDDCEPGSFYLAQNGNKWFGHAGTVLSTSIETMTTFEGNTGAQSVRDGDGAYIRIRNIKKNGDLVTKGFVRVYPENKIPQGKI